MWKKGKWFLLCLPPLVLVGLLAWWWLPGRSLTPVDIELSYETTRLTGPIQEDGTVNYVEALDARYREGVTRDNNAAILLIQALGEKFLPREQAHIYQRLGIDPPDPAATFVSIWDFAYEQAGGTPASAPSRSKPLDLKELLAGPRRPPDAYTLAARREDENARQAATRPWAAEEFPVLEAWLQANEEPLALVVAASRLPRCYVPLATPGTPSRVLDIRLSYVSAFREVATALIIRGTLRCKSGDLEAAWSDFIAVRRVGHLLSGGPTLLYRLMGVLIIGQAAEASRLVTASDHLTIEQGKAFLADLQSLPGLPGLAEPIDTYERYFCLDGVVGIATAERGDPRRFRDQLPLRRNWLPPRYINWNPLLRRINRIYDLGATALSAPTWAARKSARADYEREAQAATESLKKPWWSRPSAECVSDYLLGIFVISLSSTVEKFEIDSARILLTDMAVGLSVWRLEHGEYPTSLSELAPLYPKGVSADPFTDQPLRYRREGKGYILYSVGPNMTDDGGRDRIEDKAPDDIVVRVE